MAGGSARLGWQKKGRIRRTENELHFPLSASHHSASASASPVIYLWHVASSKSPACRSWFPTAFASHCFQCIRFVLALVSRQLLGLRPISSLRRTRHQLRLRATAAARRIRALFWRSKKSLEPRETVDLSLGYYALTAPGVEDVAAAESRPKHISPSVVNSISEVSADDWDACAIDAAGPEKYNPFLSHGFLSSLEESNSVVKETGWMPRHIGAKDESGTVVGVVPFYLKSHLYGEFVFDHSWADAYYSYGSRYYPKYQCCVPFTPVIGPRILLRDSLYKDQVFDIVVDALRKFES